MLPVGRWVFVLCVSMPILAQAQRAPLYVAGGVYEDSPALALREHFIPTAGVTVRLHQDGGDGLPSGDDRLVATVKTDASGLYVLGAESPAPHWLSVDSRPASGNAWAEQTFGPAGALCAQPDGSTRTAYFEGPCFGGRSGASDEPGSLATSEHVARVIPGSSAHVDFAFSFNVVTSTADGERRQGSLRQFLHNAAGIPGPNAMRFVPVERAVEQRQTTIGVAPRWWRIAFASPLPEITDDETVVDGTAWHFLSPASRFDAHPGRLGERPTVTPGERAVPLLEKPELELVVSGAEGIVCAARCGVRALSIHGAQAGVVLRADAQVDHVLIGAAPDSSPVSPAGSTGLQVERGTTVVRQLFVSGLTQAGVIVGPEARLDGERLEVMRCGSPQSGGGVVLLSSGSTLQSSVLASNSGAGLVIGSPDGSAPASSNLIESCTISSNTAGVVIGPGSSRNNIVRNDITWNRLGGITYLPSPGAPGVENRFSANRFDENGLRPIVLSLEAPGASSCTPLVSAPNSGLPAPVVTEASVVDVEGRPRAVIRGQGCPGAIIELYQSFVSSRRGDAFTNDPDDQGLPSVGEFNYLGATNTSPDGSFEASFPLSVTTRPDSDDVSEGVWASDVLRSADPADRAFAALAIDRQGNTSEMSTRTQAGASVTETTPPGSGLSAPRSGARPASPAPAPPATR